MRRNNLILANTNSTAVKLHLDPITGANAITGHGQGYIAINGNKIGNSAIVLPEKIIDPWVTAASPAAAQTLCIADFAALLALKPELVVFGSGAAFHFPDRSVITEFSKARIGFEVMDTPAACRTYNVLMSEGRRIAAALLIGFG